MIKAVIFDLDGTLLYRDASLQKLIDNQYDRLNKWVGHIPKRKYTSRFIELDCRICLKDKYESMYVGDHPENGVNAAQKIGMKGIWKKDSHWGNIETDFIIDDLAE